MEVVGHITALAFQDHPESITIDAIGLGAGIVDRLREKGIEGVIEMNVSKPAFNPERFANRRAELYWGLRERFRIGDIQLTEDPSLAEELSSLQYRLNSRGQIQMESKEEMKRRLRRSPDRADMLALLFDPSSDWMTPRPGDRRIYIPESPAARLRREMEVW